MFGHKKPQVRKGMPVMPVYIVQPVKRRPLLKRAIIRVVYPIGPRKP